jgi:protein TonB
VITQQYIDNNVPPTRNYDTVINIAPVSASPDELALLEGRMHQAVQRAVVYPMAASEMHLLGRVQVAFTLHDGRVEDVGMVRGSGFPILDRAALAAVRSASYPNTPTVQQDRSLRFRVWVAFRPTGDD